MYDEYFKDHIKLMGVPIIDPMISVHLQWDGTTRLLVYYKETDILK